jgi:hypothetical protein
MFLCTGLYGISSKKPGFGVLSFGVHFRQRHTAEPLHARRHGQRRICKHAKKGSSSTRSSASRQHWEHQQRHMQTDIYLHEHTESEEREPSPTRARRSSKTDKRAPRSHCRSAARGKEHLATSRSHPSRQQSRSSKERARRGAERSKHT